MEDYRLGDVAAAAGVSYATARNYLIDLGIEVKRTAGGHRRLSSGEAKRLIEAIKAPKPNPRERLLSEVSQ